MGNLTKPLHLVLLAGMLLMSVAASAEVADSKPFAEKKVVLQISDEDASKQTLVLNVASNLINYYGPDKIDVEIVAFGPGLRLLFAENSNAARIDGLATGSGVRFSACDNTTRKVTEALGHPPEFNSHAGHVDAGVVRILELVAQGYTLIKP